MRIVVITLTRNEAQILPFFIRHYQEFADHIIFYDSFSDDNTRKIIQEMSRRCCTTEIRDSYPPPLNDELNIEIKNTAYKSVRADWVIVVDCDEFIYHPDLIGLLERYDTEGITLPKVIGYDMIGDAIPKDGQLTKWITNGVMNLKHESKFAVFKPSIDINYLPGAHALSPVGNIVTSKNAQIKLLHYKWLSREFIQHKCETAVFSQVNHDKKYGYTKEGIPSYQDWLRQYDELRAKRQRVI